MSEATESFTVEAAGPADIRSISALVTAGVLRGHLLPRSEAEIATHLERWVVARQDQRVVGCLSLEPTEPNLWEVRSVCVAEECRGQGIGHRLVDKAERWARQAGVPRLFAVTAAHALFLGAGFSPLPPAAKEWCFVMRPIRECYEVLVANVGELTLPSEDAPLLAASSWMLHAEAPMGHLGQQRRLHHGLVALAE